MPGRRRADVTGRDTRSAVSPSSAPIDALQQMQQQVLPPLVVELSAR
jgi:hypothetical protein